MDINFQTSLKYVLIDEGGNDDDPQDHGGRTSRGITQKEYDSWCSLNSKPTSDVWGCTQDDLSTIYHDQYWEPYCDDLPSGVDYLFFDISVNAGRSRAVRQFQQALGVTVDGMFGQITLSAIQSANPTDLIQKISEIRANWYRNLAQFPRYGKGWLNRVEHCKNAALAMSRGEPHQKVSAPAAKAHNAEPAKPTVSPEASGSTTIATGGLLETLNSFKDSLEAYADTMQWVKYALIAIAVGSFGYAIWGFYKRSKVQAVM